MPFHQCIWPPRPPGSTSKEKNLKSAMAADPLSIEIGSLRYLDSSSVAQIEEVTQRHPIWSNDRASSLYTRRNLDNHEGLSWMGIEEAIDEKGQLVAIGIRVIFEFKLVYQPPESTD